MTETKPDYETKDLAIAPQSITPQLWGMLKDIGRAFHKSQKAGIHSDAEGAVKALFCLENGLPIASTMGGLYFQNGKMGIEAAVVASLLRANPDYDYHIKHLNDKGCTIEVLRRDQNGIFETIGEATFDESHARQANLLDNPKKPNWKQYPTDQYFAKAMLRAQRRFAPDVFGGPVYSTEEMDDWNVIDVEPLPPLPDDKPKPPSYDQLVEQFGPELCTEAGVFAATTEQELWKAVDWLSVLAASRESEENES